MKYCLYKIPGFVLLLFLFSCAIQKSPSGGPIDEEAPVVLKESPVNESINFSVKEIEIEFNEFVKLNNIRKELIVSPPLDEFPEVKIRGKSIVVVIEEELKDSTTYSLQFGNAIQDITESNTLEGYKYVFSTGSEIDSLKIRGKVKDFFSNEPMKGIKVLLHPQGCDSCLLKSKPVYFARTDESGTYKIENIKNGCYDIFALDDQNGNYNYDIGEKIGFPDSVLCINSDTVLTAIKVFNDQADKIVLQDYDISQAGKLSLSFNQKPDSLTILQNIGDQPSGMKYIELNPLLDSVYFWFIPEVEQSFVVKYVGITDTIIIEERKRILKAEKLKIKPKVELNSSGTIWIETNNPIEKFNDHKIVFLEDSVRIDKFRTRFLDSTFTKLSFDYPYQYGSSYIIQIPKGSIKDLYGQQNDTFLMNFVLAKKEELGTFVLEYEHIEDNYPVIIELINAKNETLRRVTVEKSREIPYEMLKPGSYRIRFIIDKNRNGYWDSGILGERRQPEPVFYLPKSIDLKANWELTEKFSFKDH